MPTATTGRSAIGLVLDAFLGDADFGQARERRLQKARGGLDAFFARRLLVEGADGGTAGVDDARRRIGDGVAQERGVDAALAHVDAAGRRRLARERVQEAHAAGMLA